MKPIALVVLTLLAPLGAAQVLLEDAPDDVGATTPAGDSVLLPGSLRGMVDLLSLEVSDSPESILLGVEVAQIMDGQEPDGARYWVQFVFEDKEYRAIVDLAGDLPIYTVDGAGLQSRNLGANSWTGVGEIEASVSVGSPARIDIAIPREFVQDQAGRTSVAGQELSNFFVMSQDHASQGTIVSAVGIGLVTEITDTMPDDGLGFGVYALQFGASGAASVEISSPLFTRGSNGESGVVIFDAYVTNHDSVARDVLVRTGEIPSQWSVEAARPAIHLESGDQVHVPIVVTIPFAHQHGTLKTFQVTIIDVGSDEELDSQEFGIKFYDVPQPARHHNQLYLHAKFDGGSESGFENRGGNGLFMSTLRDDERGVSTPLRHSYIDNGQLTGVFGWCFPLDPSLQIGLDWQDATGLLDLVLNAGAPLSGVLDGRLVVTAGATDSDFRDSSQCDSRAVHVTAELPGVSVDLPLQGSQEIQLTVEPVESRLAFGADRELYLELELVLDEAVATRVVDTPRISPGPAMALPLNEYHDELPELPADVAHFTGSPESRVLRAPGSTALVEVTLAGPPGEYSLDVLGLNTEWVSLPAGTRAEPGDVIPIRIDVPSDAPLGAVADVVLRAVHDGDLAYAHIIVETSGEPDLPNDFESASSIEPPSKDSPSVGIAMMTLGLATALSLASRRRRKP